MRNFDSNFVRESDKRGEWTADIESMSDFQQVAYHFCALLAWEDDDEWVKEICRDRPNLKLTGAVGGKLKNKMVRDFATQESKDLSEMGTRIVTMELSMPFSDARSVR